MSREHLYKGKAKFGGQWVIGNYVNFGNGVHKIWVFYTEQERELTNGDYGYWEEIDIDTLCEYTQLKDKHGNRIWENDIIKADNWLHQNMKIYCIVYDNCGFYAIHKGDVDCWNFDHLENIEVIGNRFDNPELLAER